MKRKAYRQVDHTADLAIEVRGRTLADLFKNAVLAYYDLVCEMDGVAAKKKLRFRIAADTPEDAFYQLLREVHYRQQAEGWLGRQVGVKVRRCDEITGAFGVVADPEGPATADGNISSGAFRLRESRSVILSQPLRRAKRIVLEVEIAGERFDPARHVLKDEIKAVTLHGLRVSQTRRLGRTHWKAFVVFDV